MDEDPKIVEPGEFVVVMNKDMKEVVCRVTFVTQMSVHVEFLVSAEETVLSGIGYDIKELFVSSTCNTVSRSSIVKKVRVARYKEEMSEDHDFLMRFRYCGNSFERFKAGVGGLKCSSCDKRGWKDAVFLKLHKLSLKQVSMHLRCNNKEIMPGSFIIVKEHNNVKLSVKNFAHQPPGPPPSSLHPEAGRCNSKVPSNKSCKFLHVVRVETLKFIQRRKDGCGVDNYDVEMSGTLFMRPIELGLPSNDAFELFETDQVMEILHWDIVHLANVVYAPSGVGGIVGLRRHIENDEPMFFFRRTIALGSRTITESSPARRVPPVSYRSKPPVYRMLRTLDLFSGAGGLALGLKSSGLTRSKWAVELDKDAAKSYGANFPEATVFNEDVRQWFEKLKGTIEVADSRNEDCKLPKVGGVDLVCGGPPCQGFSRLNRHRSSEKSKDNNNLTKVFFEVCLYLKTKFILFENVTAIATLENGGALKEVVAMLLESSYQVRFQVLPCCAFGVPQQRQRLILIGSRYSEVLPRLPEETFFVPHARRAIRIGAWNLVPPSNPILYPSTTVKEAIGDLEEISLKGNKLTYKECESSLQNLMRTGSDGVTKHRTCSPVTELNVQRIKMIPIGGDWRWLSNELIVCPRTGVILGDVLNYADQGAGKYQLQCACRDGGKCPKGTVKSSIPRALAHTADANNNWQGAFGRISWDDIFATVTTRPHPLRSAAWLVHPTQQRFLTTRELARAQTFPDDFKFFGRKDSMLRQVGNAVPPLLALSIGRQFRLDIAVVPKM